MYRNYGILAESKAPRQLLDGSGRGGNVKEGLERYWEPKPGMR